MTPDGFVTVETPDVRQFPVEQPYAVRALSQRNSSVKLDVGAAG